MPYATRPGSVQPVRAFFFVAVTDTLSSSGTASPPRTWSALHTAIALVRSLVAYVVVSLYLLVVGPVAILLALLLRTEDPLFGASRAGATLALAIPGIRFRTAGRENVPSGGIVFCANHQSNVDSPVLFLALYRRVYMLYKIGLDNVPILAQAMHIGHYVAIDRRDRQQAMRALDRAAGLIRGGRAFLIHPEGTRSRTGELQPFKKGGFIMAIQAQAPIVPVAITGASDAMRKGSAIIRPVLVSVRIGAPVETRGLTADDRDAVMLEVRARIENLLAQGPIT